MINSSLHIYVIINVEQDRDYNKYTVDLKGDLLPLYFRFLRFSKRRDRSSKSISSSSFFFSAPGISGRSLGTLGSEGKSNAGGALGSVGLPGGSLDRGCGFGLLAFCEG